jgi:hypothetical protein
MKLYPNLLLMQKSVVFKTYKGKQGFEDLIPRSILKNQLSKIIFCQFSCW